VRARSWTIVLPLLALLACTVSAIALAARAGLSFCNARWAIPLPDDTMPSMPGMDMSAMPAMPAGHALMICPIVLALIAGSALLAGAALVVVWRDPHRGLARRGIVSALAALPPLRTAASLIALGACAFGAMAVADGAAAPGLPTLAALATLLVACSIAATLLSIVAGRVALACGRRLWLAIVAAIASAPGAPAPPCLRLVPAGALLAPVSLLAAGRGLRAPPLVLR
jgi:hypothetical protein